MSARSSIGHLMVAGVGLVLLNTGGAAALTFSDSMFADTDWSASKVFDSTPGANATIAAAQVLNGGNPGAFRSITHDWTGPGGVDFAQLRAGAIYVPAVQGALTSIDFSFDLRFLGGSTGTSQVGYLLDLFQDGRNYFSAGTNGVGVAQGPGNGQQGDWMHFAATGFSAADFAPVSAGGPAHPDFSTSGAPIQLGFLSTNGSADSLPVETRSGTDNWVVTLHPVVVPEPSTLVLLGFGLLPMLSSPLRGIRRRGAAC